MTGSEVGKNSRADRDGGDKKPGPDITLCDDDPNSDTHDWVLTEAAAWFNYYQCRKCGATSKADSGV